MRTSVLVPNASSQKPILRVVSDEISEPVRLQRAMGTARLSFKRLGDRTALNDLYQSGCFKIRLPRMTGSAHPEAVLINTSGGLTDGDRLDTQCSWQPGTRAALTTQASERIYKSRQENARITTRLTVGEAATALWLPQDTIMFDGGRLERRMDIDLDHDASLVACEAVVLGRPAMGETVHAGRLLDTWMIRQGGKLIFADRLELDGDMTAKLDRPGAGAGARAFASVVVCGPNLVRRHAALSEVLGTLPTPAGCSHLGAALLVRVVADNGYDLRKSLVKILMAASERFELPRVWTC